MPRTTLTPTAVNRSFNTPAETAIAADGMEFTNKGKEFVTLTNTNGAAAVDVTLITFTTVDGEAVDDKQVSVPANGKRIVGPFPPSVYNQPSGMVHIDVSTTDITADVWYLSEL